MITTLKPFDSTTEFPLDEETFTKQKESLWFARLAMFIGDKNNNKSISKEEIDLLYDKYRNQSFFFKINDEYLRFFADLGLTDIDSFIFPNPMFDTTILDFHLFLVTNGIGNDFFVIDKEVLKSETVNWDYEGIMGYIESAEFSIEYLIECTMRMNDIAKEENHEDFLPEFNALAQLKLNELI